MQTHKQSVEKKTTTRQKDANSLNESKHSPTIPTIAGITHHHAKVNGTDLHYVAAGKSGSPILLVHRPRNRINAETDKPGWPQGATTRNTRRYCEEEQRSGQPGSSVEHDAISRAVH